MKKWWRRIRRLLKLSILLGIIWLILEIGNLFHLPNWWPSWLGFGQNHSELMKGQGEKENQVSNTPILEKEFKAETTSSPNRSKPTEIATPNETMKPVQKLPTIVPAMESMAKITPKPTVVPTAKVTMEPTAAPIAKITAEPTIMPTTNVTVL